MMPPSLHDALQYTYRICGCRLCEGPEVASAAVLHIADPLGRSAYRTYHDLASLGKKASKIYRVGQVGLEFPSTRIKKLISNIPWEFEGDGWRADMIKGLHVVNEWLNSLDPALLARFFDENAYKEEKLQLNARLQYEKHARKLQQYFMATSNIEFVVAEALKDSCRSTVYIEPSCGDGRLLLSLAARENVLGVSGCELDAEIAARTRAACAASESRGKCHIHTGNFLSTTKADLTPAMKLFWGEDLNDIVVFGGPPYTLGGGDGDLRSQGDPTVDTGRDLPLQFIRHAAVVLNPRKIVFLLPPRCAEPEFIERTLCSMQNDDIAEGKDKSSWQVITHPAPCNEFDFCGRIIRQPSVIQVWTHLERSAATDSICDDGLQKRRKISTS